MTLLSCFALSFALAAAFAVPAREILRRAGHVRRNYAGRAIPTSSGLVLVASAVAAAGIAVALGLADERATAPCMALVASASLVGFMDDILGSHAHRGIAGHLRAFLVRRRITTGLAKALAIVAFSVAALNCASARRSTFDLLATSALVAMCANSLNLLDLRPARAAKAFLAGGLALLAFADATPGAVAAALAGSLAAGLRDELGERSMLGDAGSNALGAALGYWLALGAGCAARVAALVALALLHVLAERRSLSKLIEEDPVLDFIDRLGRA